MKKIPILILHGWQVPVARYFSLKELFQKAGFQVLVPQLPGFAFKETIKKAYQLDDYLDFVVDFLKKKKIDNIFLIGHSFGGRIAIKFAILHPEKIRALILTGVPAIREKKFKRQMFFVAAKIGKIFFAIPPFSFLQPVTRKLLYFLSDEWDYYQTKGKMRETFQKIINENLESLLTKIKAPTLLIWGEKDRIVPLSVAQEMVKRISGAKLTIIANASHKLPYEKPKIFSEKCLKFFIE